MTLTAVQMVTPSVVFAAGDGVIERSDDGGLTWRSLPIACDACGDLHFAQIDMLTTTFGWAAGSTGLFHTTDGEHWVVQPTGLAHEPALVHFVSSAEGWLVSAPWGAGEFIGLPDAVVAQTTDGGATWMPLTATPPDVQSVCFATPNDGWLATRDTVYRSTDSGATWQQSFRSPLPVQTGAGLVELQCAAPGAAWIQFEPGGAAGGSEPYGLYTTADSGRHWTPVVAGSVVSPQPGVASAGAYPGPFSVIDPLTAFVVDYSPNGPFLAGRFVTNGHDLGPPTQITAANPGGVTIDPLAVSFSDPNDGVVVGDGAPGAPNAYVTRTGGQSWTPVSAGAVGASPSCTTRQLAGRLAGIQGSAGHLIASLWIANTSATACSLAPNATVELLEADNRVDTTLTPPPQTGGAIELTPNTSIDNPAPGARLALVDVAYNPIDQADGGIPCPDPTFNPTAIRLRDGDAIVTIGNLTAGQFTVAICRNDVQATSPRPLTP